MSGQVRSGQVRSGQVRSGQGSGQVRSGQVRSGQVRSGRVGSYFLHTNLVFLQILGEPLIHVTRDGIPSLLAQIIDLLGENRETVDFDPIFTLQTLHRA